jgi:glycine cleavage system aminomethyltransferase T
MNKPDMLTMIPTIPFEGDVSRFFYMYGWVVPFEFSGWRDETMSWKEGAYLGAVISTSPTFRIKGPDTIKFLSDHFVNGFKNFPVGTSRHGIMCNEKGLDMMDGMILRTAEDEVYTYWLQPYIGYCFQKGKYNALGEDISGTVFLYQVAGPRSLEILEEASGDDLHDIKFFHHRMSKIAGHDVRILRVGMAGTLAYEVHGSIDDSHEVYKAIFGAGKDYGMRKLGQVAYMMNHTEDGFPQANYHFGFPWYEDHDFAEYLNQRPFAGFFNYDPILVGSMGTDIKLRYRNPVELGWANRIKFDHDFVGRAAFEKIMANPKRQMVTLEWNAEDIGDVFASQFRDDVPYQHMDRPNDMYYEVSPRWFYHADQVLKDGKLVGISSGRSISQFYHRMISLSSIDVEYAALGTDVIVLWGNPGTRQKEIRAKVARYPYLTEERNDVVDVSKIPRAAKK